MRATSAECEFLSTERVNFADGGKARNPWIHSHPPLCAREYLICERNQGTFDGRILPSSRGRKGIHGHPHLQDKSQIASGLLDRGKHVLPRVKLSAWLPLHMLPYEMSC